MTDDKSKTQEQLNQEELEKIRVELETQALIKRMNAGNDPMTPVEEPVSEDDAGLENTARPGTSPNEVIDEEGLGRK